MLLGNSVSFGLGYGFTWDYGLQRVPINNIHYSKNSEALDRCLEKKDFETIIKDHHLFWLIYCKAIVSYQNQEKVNSFFVSIENKNIKFSGQKSIVEEIQTIIEKMRIFFLEGLKHRSFEILIIDELDEYHFGKESELISFCSKRGHTKSIYQNFIQPALSTLAELCGARYVEDKKNQLIQKNDSTAQLQEIQVIRISWIEEFHLAYSIPPKTIPEREDIGKALYDLYQKQICCDFTLNTKDDVIQVHSSLLYLHGGPVIQSLLKSDMKEVKDKKILFKEFSLNTIKAFIEFVYLGGKIFSDTVVSTAYKNTLDFSELFVFAHTYQIEELLDCCTNFLSLFANQENLEHLQSLEKTYHNEHLKQICEYFSKKGNIHYIKA